MEKINAGIAGGVVSPTWIRLRPIWESLRRSLQGGNPDDVFDTYLWQSIH